MSVERLAQMGRVAASRIDLSVAGSEQGIWRLDLAQGVSTRFTFDPAPDSSPVQPFPAAQAGGSKTQVSRDGGDQPRWRRDGKELFYLSLDGKLMAVKVAEGPTFRADVPESLFQALVVRGRRESLLGVLRWDVAPDGKHFLIILQLCGPVQHDREGFRLRFLCVDRLTQAADHRHVRPRGSDDDKRANPAGDVR